MTSTLHVGDCRAIMATLPAESVQTVCTSPPYYGLRSYLPGGHADKALEIGLEPSPQAYVDELVAVFRELRRVLRPDGTCWLNIGDSYASNGISGLNQGWAERAAEQYRGGGHKAEPSRERGKKSVPPGLKPKDLMMIPARVALALQADGWWLRSEIIFSKAAPMPESVRDRPTCAHEKVFLLTKAANYFYDSDAVAEPILNIQRPNFDGTRNMLPKGSYHRVDRCGNSASGTRNIRNVWHLNPREPFPGAHFATMPPTLAERCIKAGTSEKGQCPCCGAPWARVVEGEKYVPPLADADAPRAVDPSRGDKSRKLDGKSLEWREAVASRKTTGWHPSCTCPEHQPVPQTVLDPFSGSGTTLLVADRLQRHGIGIELNGDYAAMARQRLISDAPLLAEVAA